MSCHYCGTSERMLRPYGPAGADVCHACANATPERTAATTAAMVAVFAAAEAMSPTHVVVLRFDGFHPSDGTVDPPPA